jgi:hypothetical protein
MLSDQSFHDQEHADLKAFMESADRDAAGDRHAQVAARRAVRA